MGQALYRTYRSKKLAEIVGQEHITTALNHALKEGTISHAYLFTGPRGVGKTSIARILAHEINELPYNEDRPHLDIIEIDAASNRRIDEIRDLRDKVHITPTSARYKVYIIDEVHMLTKEAFNALLKTLEEPPAHAIFILATTEAHKLPETIISRTQRFAFKPVEKQKVIDHLRHIAQQEKITISDEALDLIAAHGEGSFRDSISLLDQIRNTKGSVDIKDVEAMLGIAPAKLISDILDAVSVHDSVKVTKNLRLIYEQGLEPSQIARQLGASLRQTVINKTDRFNHNVSIKLLSELVLVPASPDPHIALEICLLNATFSEEDNAKLKTTDAPVSKVMPEESVKTKPAIQVDPKTTSILDKKPKEQPLPITPKEEESKESAPDVSEADSDMILNTDAWELILNAVKQKHNTLYSLINSAQPHFEPGKITLEFSYVFHQKRLNESRNKEILTTIIQGVTGALMQIECILGQGKPQITTPPSLPPADGEIVHDAKPEPAASAVNTVSDIFGGAELLEA